MSDFLGLYQGSVADNNDPTNNHRVKVLVPAILGTEQSGWCNTIYPTIYTPQVGEIVWIQFVNGDLTQPVYFSSMAVDASKIIADSIRASQLVADYMNGLVITGGVFQTSASTNPRVWFDTSGFHATNSGGTQTVNIDTSGNVTANNLSAANATISGNVTATTGAIGNWTISGNVLRSASSPYTTLDSTGTGTITTGNLQATGGTIGGWVVNSTNITSGSGGMVLNDNGTLTGGAINGSTFTSTSGGGNRIDINATTIDTITWYNAGNQAAQLWSYSPSSGQYGIQLNTNVPSKGGGVLSMDTTGTAVLWSYNASAAQGGWIQADPAKVFITSPNSLSTITVDNSRVTLSGVVGTSGVLINSDTQINGALVLHGSVGKFSQDTAITNGFISATINGQNLTSGTNNVVVHTSNGIVGWATSSRQYKTNIQDLDPEDRPSLIDNLRPVTYEDKAHHALFEAGDPLWQHDFETNYGFIAEEVEELGWTELVSHHADDREIMSIHYDRIIAPLILELRERFTAIEARLDKAGL